MVVRSRGAFDSSLLETPVACKYLLNVLGGSLFQMKFFECSHRNKKLLRISKKLKQSQHIHVKQLILARNAVQEKKWFYLEKTFLNY